jgi:hypothetical protein
MPMVLLLCFHRGQGFDEDRLQDRKRPFQSIGQAHVMAESFQLGAIQSGSFASCIDRHEEVLAAMASCGG